MRPAFVLNRRLSFPVLCVVVGVAVPFFASLVAASQIYGSLSELLFGGIISAALIAVIVVFPTLILLRAIESGNGTHKTAAKILTAIAFLAACAFVATYYGCYDTFEAFEQGAQAQSYMRLHPFPFFLELAFANAAFFALCLALGCIVLSLREQLQFVKQREKNDR